MSTASKKKIMNLDEVKASLHPSRWRAVTFKIDDDEVTFIVKKPNLAATKLMTEFAERKDPINGMVTMVKMCLLSHTDEDFNKIVDENPELLNAIVEEMTPMMSAQKVEAKKD